MRARPTPAAVLCDADGCLFPSEEPAFAACAEIANRLALRLGVTETFTGESMRRELTGMNFRSIAAGLASAHAARLDEAELEGWVAQERDAVTRHLRETLRPDGDVIEALSRISAGSELALVSSSALSRIAACLEVTGLADLLPEAVRFSAEDSLAVPTSKPDPAVYQLALDELGIAPEDAVAVEDSPPGVLAAARAGIPTIGNLAFVAPGERPARARELEGAGAVESFESWAEIASALAPADAGVPAGEPG